MRAPPLVKFSGIQKEIINRIATRFASAQKYTPNGYTLRAQQLTPLELADFTSGIPTIRAGQEAPRGPVFAWRLP
jgi:hypothetical protein